MGSKKQLGTCKSDAQNTFRKLAEVLGDTDSPQASDTYLELSNNSLKAREGHVHNLVITFHKVKATFKEERETLERLRFELSHLETQVKKEEAIVIECMNKEKFSEHAILKAKIEYKAANELVKTLRQEEVLTVKKPQSLKNEQQEKAAIEEIESNGGHANCRPPKRWKATEHETKTEGQLFKFSSSTGTVPVGCLAKDNPYIVAMKKVGVEMISSKLRRQTPNPNKRQALKLDIAAFLNEKFGEEKPEQVVIGGKIIDDMKLLNEVLKVGGIESVLRGRALFYITRVLDISSNDRSIGTRLKSYYCKTLYAYEQYLTFRTLVTKTEIQRVRTIYNTITRRKHVK